MFISCEVPCSFEEREREREREILRNFERGNNNKITNLVIVVTSFKKKQENGFCHTGGKSSWNNAGEEVKSIVSQTKSLIAKIKADFSRRKRQATSNSTDYTQCAVSGKDVQFSPLTYWVIRET